jgi:SpoIID/LytB domain protein
MRTKDVPNSILEKLTGVNNILGVTVRRWDANANAIDIQIMGKKKTTEVHGVILAQRLGLSTAGILDVHENNNNTWRFTYRGPGNGVRGLSQHGADMFASRGWNFMQILQQYYMDPDGKLRLDYMDRYHARRVGPATVKAPQAETKSEED